MTEESSIQFGTRRGTRGPRIMQTQEDRMREARRQHAFLIGLEHKAAQTLDEPIPASSREPIVGHAHPCGRNHPCPCGSGLKFKNCHLTAFREARLS